MALHEYELSQEFRGYSRHEVDRLLRNFTATVEQLEGERRTLQDELVEVRSELEVNERQLDDSDGADAQ